PSPARRSGSREFFDGVDGADLGAFAAPGAAVGQDAQRVAAVRGPSGVRADGVFGAGEQAGSAALAAAGDAYGQAHRDPRGVTKRPATARLRLDPTMTTVNMSIRAGSSSARVVSVTVWSGRVALRTYPTGVSGGRWAARIARAFGSCQSRARLRGL